MNKPPQHLIDAARRGDWIDPKDPYVRKMMREAKKEEKQRKEQEEQQSLQRSIDLQIQSLEVENELYEQNEFFNNNTIDWNCNQQCKYCDSTSMRIIERPDLSTHYAEYKCNVCHRHHTWIPWSKKCTNH